MQRVHTVPYATKKSCLLVYVCVCVLQLTWANLGIYKELHWFHFFTSTSILSSWKCSLEFRTLSVLNDNFMPILCFTLNILLVMQHQLHFPAEARQSTISTSGRLSIISMQKLPLSIKIFKFGFISIRSLST